MHRMRRNDAGGRIQDPPAPPPPPEGVRVPLRRSILYTAEIGGAHEGHPHGTLLQMRQVHEGLSRLENVYNTYSDNTGAVHTRQPTLPERPGPRPGTRVRVRVRVQIGRRGLGNINNAVKATARPRNLLHIRRRRRLARCTGTPPLGMKTVVADGTRTAHAHLRHALAIRRRGRRRGRRGGTRLGLGLGLGSLNPKWPGRGPRRGPGRLGLGRRRPHEPAALKHGTTEHGPRRRSTVCVPHTVQSLSYKHHNIKLVSQNIQWRAFRNCHLTLATRAF